MPWTQLPDNTLQVFAGGKTGLDPYAKTLFNSSCDCTQGSIQIDRLLNPMQFDRGLSHLSPSGGRETYDFGYHQQQLVNEEIRNFINSAKVGAKIEIIAIPNFSVITGLAVSVYAMDPGLVLSLHTRNGTPLPTSGQKVQVPLAGCLPNITSATAAANALSTIQAPAATNSSEHFVYAQYGTTNFTTNADVLVLEVVTMPTSGVISAGNRIQVDLSYDTLLRLYR